MFAFGKGNQRRERTPRPDLLPSPTKGLQGSEIYFSASYLALALGDGSNRGERDNYARLHLDPGWATEGCELPSLTLALDNQTRTCSELSMP